MTTVVKPYDEKLVYEANYFKLRLVQETDAVDLLMCYSDTKTALLFNEDYCRSNELYKSEAEMIEVILFWLKSYKNRESIRLAIIDKLSEKVIGTIGITSMDRTKGFEDTQGLLMLDIYSAFERPTYIKDLLDTIHRHVYEDFGVSELLIKIPEQGRLRKTIATHMDYQPYDREGYTPKQCYYMRPVSA